MNKRQKKKRFKKLYGMNPKQYQQAMQLVSLEEPLKKFVDSETATFTDLGSCFERIKDGLQKLASVSEKFCEAFSFLLRAIWKGAEK